MKPELSKHFASRKPSAIRLAQIEFMGRQDDIGDINVAIGNVSLPMHPAMIERMNNLSQESSPFNQGVVKYTNTIGFAETNTAFLNIIASSGFETEHLYSQITDGGSQAMELVIVGICGDAGTDDKPLLLIDAAYTNYKALSKRLGRKIVSVSRDLDENGNFNLPDMNEIRKVIEEHKPGGVIVIPYDNPTGQLYDHKSMVDICKLCAEYNMWVVSDEAYRELFYKDGKTISIWGVTEEEVPGITGRRISIETSSKVWNACGLRIGALVTDNEEFNKRSVAENTANLCPSAIGQYIFGSLAHERYEDLNLWYKNQRDYYAAMLNQLTTDMKKIMPGVIVSSPDASIYSVVDVRNLVDDDFDASDFAIFCARSGKVNIDGQDYTLIVAPLAEFYNIPKDKPNPGRTQMRIAYVESPEQMAKVPTLFAELLDQYLNQ